MNQKKEISDFLQLAYAQGKVREVEEAFDEYSVEEEWHKGKVESFLKDDSEEYSAYQIGDIVFVQNYMYSNGHRGKNHLFVIIDQNNLAVPIENFGMLISSQLNKLKYNANIMIKKNLQNNLKKDSLVKTDIVYKISNKQILFKIGKVDLERVEEYKKKFEDISK